MPASASRRSSAPAPTPRTTETDQSNRVSASRSRTLMRVCSAVGRAPARRRQHAPARARDVVLRTQDQVHPGGQRMVGLSAAQTLAGQMNRHQRRRARGVEGDRRPAEVVEVGHPVRDDRGGGAGQRIRGGVLGALAQAEGRQQLVVVRGGADEHTDRRTLEIARRDVRVLECLPGQLERETLLRVGSLEIDLIARYVERMLSAPASQAPPAIK